MIVDRDRFNIDLEKYDGGPFKFVGDEVAYMLVKKEAYLLIVSIELVMFIILKVWYISYQVWVRCVVKVIRSHFMGLDVKLEKQGPKDLVY